MMFFFIWILVVDFSMFHGPFSMPQSPPFFFLSFLPPIREQTGLTPLMLACKKGHFEVVEALLLAADTDAVDKVQRALFGRWMSARSFARF